MSHFISSRKMEIMDKNQWTVMETANPDPTEATVFNTWHLHGDKRILKTPKTHLGETWRTPAVCACSLGDPVHWAAPGACWCSPEPSNKISRHLKCSNKMWNTTLPLNCSMSQTSEHITANRNNTKSVDGGATPIIGWVPYYRGWTLLSWLPGWVFWRTNSIFEQVGMTRHTASSVLGFLGDACVRYTKPDTSFTSNPDQVR